MGDVGLDVDLTLSRTPRCELWPAEWLCVPGGDAWDDLLVFVIGTQTPHPPRRAPAIVLEQTFHAPLGRAAHLAVVHQNLCSPAGTRISALAKASEPSAFNRPFVIAVIVRDDDGIDRLRIDAAAAPYWSPLDPAVD